MAISLGDLASRLGCELIGDKDNAVDNVASLQNANARSLSFLSSPALKPLLESSKAGCVIVREEDAADCPGAALVSDNPYVAYARAAAVVCPEPVFPAGIHRTAQVADSASVDESAHIGPNAVIGERASIGANTYIGPGCFVGPDCSIGSDGHVVANVSVVRNVTIGNRCILHPGAVIGADGFGNAITPEGWIKVPQLGGVRIGDDVEIGANSTVDRGALDDTVIENGVRIDNLVMIGHNVRVGAHTAMAAMTGIAGSTVIGKRCMFAGQAGCAGHITIGDDVVISGQGMVSKSILDPGVYASSFPVELSREWNRKVARFRRLDVLTERVKELEKDKS